MRITSYPNLGLTCTQAVLGLHAIKEKPVAIDGKVEIRPVSDHHPQVSCYTDMVQMMYLALTYDHRLLDGREAVVFLVKVGQSWKTCIHADMRH